MAQPNVVREPSMDEILASIRRIIESNDPVPQPGIATGRAEPEGFSGRPANDDMEEVTLTVDERFAADDSEDLYVDPTSIVSNVSRLSGVAPVAREAEVSNTSETPASQPAQMQPRALSLADVAARVRAASERREPAVQEHVVEEAPELAVPSEEPAETVFEARQQPVEHYAPELDTAEELVDEVVPQPVSLLSSSVGEQVARSFESLALAVDDAERRSFDQMAEDMLRPMLQEWLDDNLPKLVERLVREEIERVARGVRR
ncbi:DUF2497 domain-containing protein [Rhizobium sp. KVB221]|uniref:DUF2497 domain-containing protein n=1 Tax=Rhizobium setariae TaxID=2801340 RepID=A0A936YUJ2_9HYPH|nr:DUF2497 domain-containing protein [Rhizobium setariae]MBL0372870.1 DUF2497 domain-containing protein [Rhizobium setariae]